MEGSWHRSDQNRFERIFDFVSRPIQRVTGVNAAAEILKFEVETVV